MRRLRESVLPCLAHRSFRGRGIRARQVLRILFRASVPERHRGKVQHVVILYDRKLNNLCPPLRIGQRGWSGSPFRTRESFHGSGRRLRGSSGSERGLQRHHPRGGRSRKRRQRPNVVRNQVRDDVSERRARERHPANFSLAGSNE